MIDHRNKFQFVARLGSKVSPYINRVFRRKRHGSSLFGETAPDI